MQINKKSERVDKIPKKVLKVGKKIADFARLGVKAVENAKKVFESPEKSQKVV